MNRVRGVYLVIAPAGVYVGESGDCDSRDPLYYARLYGRNCGVVCEMPGSTRAQRELVEDFVAMTLSSAGVALLSTHRRRPTALDVSATTWDTALLKRAMEWRKA